MNNTEWTDEALLSLHSDIAHASHLHVEGNGSPDDEIGMALSKADALVIHQLTRQIVFDETEMVLNGELSLEDHLETLKRVQETGSAI